MLSDSNRPKSSLFSGLPAVLATNLVYFLVSVLLTLFLPKVMSLESFGYWQLYQLYILYLGYLTFGYSDGINLRIAGLRRDTAPKKEVSNGIVYLVIAESIAFGIFMTTAFLASDAIESKIFLLACISTLFYIPRTLIAIVFQSIGESKKYSIIIVTERIVLIVSVSLLFFFGEISLIALLLIEIFSKLCSLALAVGLVFNNFLKLSHLSMATFKVFLHDCASGLYVLGANILAMVINGGVRLMVIDGWNIVIFGQISLAFQFASMFMVLINSVSISVLPNIKRIDTTKFRESYQRIRLLLVTPLFPLFLLFFPFAAIVSLWLPNYEIAIQYTALFFPVFVYESINRGVTASFLKALRLERALLFINLAAAVFSLAFAFFSVYIWKSLDLTVLSIVAGLALRALLSEILIAHHLCLDLKKTWIVETILVVLYLLSVSTAQKQIFLILFALSLMAYLVPQGHKIVTASHRD